MFFVHPCNTPEALSHLNTGIPLNPEDYLFLWLGLMGSSVGLYVPSKLLIPGFEKKCQHRLVEGRSADTTVAPDVSL